MSGAAVRADSMIPDSKLVSILTAEYLRPAEVAAVLKVSRKALADMRLTRSGPMFVLQARGVVAYPAEPFRAWLRRRAQTHGHQVPGPHEARWSRKVVIT
jgi:hypothetical protein